VGLSGSTEQRPAADQHSENGADDAGDGMGKRRQGTDGEKAADSQSPE
jgi:hypothetical protein